MTDRMIDTPWGEVRLVSMPQPASEADFDLAPPWLRELVEPHFGEGHALWVEVTLLGLERVECCGEVLWRRDDG